MAIETIESITKRHEKRSALWEQEMAMRTAFEELDSALWINVKNAKKEFFAQMPADKIQGLYDKYLQAYNAFEAAKITWESINQ